MNEQEEVLLVDIARREGLQLGPNRKMQEQWLIPALQQRQLLAPLVRSEPAQEKPGETSTSRSFEVAPGLHRTGSKS